jgi:hypothetical protein
LLACFFAEIYTGSELVAIYLYLQWHADPRGNVSIRIKGISKSGTEILNPSFGISLSEKGNKVLDFLPLVAWIVLFLHLQVLEPVF